MTDLTHNPDHYPHNGGNADTDLLCRACEMGVPVKRAMPGPPEKEPHDSGAFPHDRDASALDYCPGCAHENRLRLAEPKRLTAAEAAAEYWRAVTAERDHAIAIDYGVAPDHDMPVLVADTWHRFASLPHALEVGA